MRRYVWMVRVGFLLVAGALGIGAVEARQQDESFSRSVGGVTGQQQPIDVDVDDDGRATGFATTLHLQCSNGSEWRNTWTASDGVPVDFEWEGERLRVVEPKHEDYGSKGGWGRGVARMVARVTDRGLEGRMRMVWRRQVPGHRVACDSGQVPFAVGRAASGRIAAMRPTARPWVAYPQASGPAVAKSAAQQRLLMRLDATCMKWSERRSDDATFTAYLRWQEREVDDLRSQGRSPERYPGYIGWLSGIEQRLALERSQLAALERGDLAQAALLRAELSAVKAHGNAAGLRLGLRTCVSNGPAGAPRF